MAEPEIDLGSNAQPVVAPNLVMGTPAMISPDLSAEQLRLLRAQGFPEGLAKELGKSRLQFPLRFWLVDNSGSMNTSDGTELRGTQDKLVTVRCTRWKELQSTVMYHAELAGFLEISTTFIFINNPGLTVGPQELVVNGPQDIERTKEVVSKASPTGTTPLTQHLEDVYNRVSQLKEGLQTQGQKAVVVIATDGLPNNKDAFLVALKRLQQLPVWVVIRLCTNSDSIVDYYNDLDAQLEAPLEVIDDFWAEGAEVHKVNPWINYTLQIHRSREMGYQHRLFDLLDETRLSLDQVTEYLKIVLGDQLALPDPHTDWKGFLNALKNALSNEKRQYNPNTKKLGDWVDVKQLQKTFGKGGGMLGLFRK